ncbi:MAG: dephospho-CoA kinase [Planctomycetaceae bacterium]|nr:dephospho-CoA kinase [Planctomycetaceae bacterium]
MTQRTVPILGIIGGVGSGKSTLAAWLSDQLSVVVLDADAAGHEALRDDAVRVALRHEFGAEVFDATGQVDRSRLATKVFGDGPDFSAARRRLEAIVHPVIRHRLEQQMADIRRHGDSDLIILDAAVMMEACWNELCDVVVFVDTPRSMRLQRVAASRGWNEAELNRREASQWSLDRKRHAANAVIDNSGPIDQAGPELLSFLVSRFPTLTPGRTGAALATAGSSDTLP